MNSTWLDSVLRMPNIESFPDSELTEMMHFFAHGQHRTFESDTTSSQKNARRRLESTAERPRRRWFENADISEEKSSKYQRLFRFTYHTSTIRLVHYSAKHNGESTVQALADGLWLEYPYLLCHVINAVCTVELCEHMDEWTIIQEAIKHQVHSLPALERLDVRIITGPDSQHSEKMSSFLESALANFVDAERQGLRVEVHIEHGPVPPPEKWRG